MRMTIAARSMRRKASTYTALPGASFHGASVEAMVAAAASGNWDPPPLPEIVADAMLAANMPQFNASSMGRQMRDAHFKLDPSWTFVNHGAFGAPSAVSMDVAAAWRQHAERQPLRFIDRELFAHLVESHRSVAKWIGADSPEQLVLVSNATAGLNVVIASVVRKTLCAEDEVLLLDVGYGSVRTMVEHACRQSGAKPVVLSLADHLPESALSEELLSRVSAAISPRTRLAIFDDITSNHALSLPVTQLCALCDENGVPCLIDAAHGVGSRPVAQLPYLSSEFAQARPAFCVGNLHKWANAPRGAAFLWARDEEHRQLLEPPIISHGFGAGFASSFIWQGANDYSSMLALPAVIEWWGQSGMRTSVQYQQRLLAEAVQILGEAWETGPLIVPAPNNNMALVRLPELGAVPGHEDGPVTGKLVQDALHFAHNVECPVKTLQGNLYVRISAAAYNTLEDYVHLANAVGAMR